MPNVFRRTSRVNTHRLGGGGGGGPRGFEAAGAGAEAEEDNELGVTFTDEIGGGGGGIAVRVGGAGGGTAIGRILKKICQRKRTVGYDCDLRSSKSLKTVAFEMTNTPKLPQSWSLQTVLLHSLLVRQCLPVRVGGGGGPFLPKLPVLPFCP